jgi:uncharacterized protein (UPF0332 family)
MKPEQLNLIQNARHSISAVKLLLDNGFPGYAAARAYYAMFYIAEAFLDGEGMSFSKHSAVIGAFGADLSPHYEQFLSNTTSYIFTDPLIVFPKPITPAINSMN